MLRAHAASALRTPLMLSAEAGHVGGSEWGRSARKDGEAEDKVLRLLLAHGAAQAHTICAESAKFDVEAESTGEPPCEHKPAPHLWLRI